MNGDVIKWQVSDSTGSDRFFTITSGFLRGADVILLTFDLSSEETFLSMDTWMNEVKSKARPNVLPVLVGCKSDGEQQVQGESQARMLRASRASESPLHLIHQIVRRWQRRKSRSSRRRRRR